MKSRSTSDPTPIKDEPRPPEVEDQIRRRAFDFYEQRGRTDGHDLDDWLQAEAELTANKTKTAVA